MNKIGSYIYRIEEFVCKVFYKVSGKVQLNLLLEAVVKMYILRKKVTLREMETLV